MAKTIDELSIEEMKNLRIFDVLWYSATGRGEYELIKQVESLGFEKANEEFKLHPHGQDGIHVDWAKLKDLFYVPSAIGTRFVELDKPALFSWDDLNAFLVVCLLGGTYDKALVEKIREHSSEEKLRKLRDDSGWRQEAKIYARHLVESKRQVLSHPKAEVAEDYRQPVEAILTKYLQDMR